MKINNQFLPILASTSFLSVAGLTIGSTSSSAAGFYVPGSLDTGDQLTIVGDVNVLGAGAFEFFEDGSPPGPSESVGDYGNFGVTGSSTGGFASLSTNGTIDPIYKIQSSFLDADGLFPGGPGIYEPFEPADPFGGANALTNKFRPTDSSPFLSFDFDGDIDTLDTLDFSFTEINFLQTNPIGGGQEQFTVAGLGNFTDSEGNIIASASFNGTRVIGPGNNSYSGTFVVQQDAPPPDVPEPASIIGLFAFTGLVAGAISKKDRAVKKSGMSVG